MLLLIISCSSQQEQIVGTWAFNRVDNNVTAPMNGLATQMMAALLGNLTIEFHADGSCRTFDDMSGGQSQFRINNGILRIKDQTGTITSYRIVSLTKSELALCDKDGVTIVYARK